MRAVLFRAIRAEYTIQVGHIDGNLQSRPDVERSALVTLVVQAIAQYALVAGALDSVRGGELPSTLPVSNP